MKIIVEDKNFKIYPGCYQKPFVESEREIFLADLFAWFDEIVTR